MTLHKNEAGKLDAFAWPGGYSIRYLCADGETVCAKCANEWLDDAESWLGQEPIGHYIHWEGQVEQCANCNCDMAPEYGDPEASE